MELLPCPFCGAAPGNGYLSVMLQETKRETTVYGLRVSPFTEYRVKCGGCGAAAGCGESGLTAMGRTVTEEEARQIAVDKWNRREP